MRRDAERVSVLSLVEQIDLLLARGDHEPFAATVGIGVAGVRVAEQLHDRTGWFPEIHRVEVTREEDTHGGYVLTTPPGATLRTQLAHVGGSSVAVVDDTVFSGLTMSAVLEALPSGLLGHTRAFCLKCVAESLPGIEELCPITPGFAAPGRMLEEVSFINASGLVKRISIRRVGKPPMAFFERGEWMEAWFPGYADEVTDLCRRINELLEQAS